jgi:hypothetical protein
LSVAAKALAAVAVADVVAFSFRDIAFYGLLPAAASLGIVLVTTRRERLAAASRTGALAMIVAGWAAVWFSVWFLVFGRTSLETVAISWSKSGVNTQFHEAEVILEPVDRRDWAVGFVSDELEQYLSQLGTRRVDATFEVTRDFGCARGYRVLQVGALKNWRYAQSYGRYGPTASAPWNNPGWCRRF